MLNKIKFSYKEANEQVGLFTPSHTLFKCKIKVDGLQYTFNYQCNTAHEEPNLMSCLNCLLLDASCYENYSLEEFITEFGGNIKSYKACKKTSKALNRLFSTEEIEEIYKELEEEGF